MWQVLEQMSAKGGKLMAFLQTKKKVSQPSTNEVWTSFQIWQLKLESKPRLNIVNKEEYSFWTFRVKNGQYLPKNLNICLSRIFGHNVGKNAPINVKVLQNVCHMIRSTKIMLTNISSGSLSWWSGPVIQTS